MNSTCELGRHTARALKPYPDYKTSGVQWLGKVPAHWEVAPVKQQYAIRLGKMLQPARRASDDHRISYLKAKHVQWFEVRTNDIDTMWATPDEVDRYGIVAGDLLVCEGGEGGRCGIVKHGTALPDPCIIQNALHRVRPRSWGSVGDISRNDYLQYMMSTVASAGWFDVLTDKATIAHFTAEKFGALLASIPPLPEQAAIVRFLDHADRRIRRYIRAKQKLIKLLEEQKQALIHQIVTRGLDPNVRLKPSGVEWLGDVPEHWEIVQLRRLALDRCDGPFGSGLKSSHYTEEGIRVVRLQNIGHAEFKNSDAAFISPEYYSSLGDHSVVAGDILIAGLGDDNHPAGRACVAPESIIPAMVKADCFRFRLNRTRVEPRFAALQLTATATAASALLSTGATRQRTNLQSTSARAIGIPTVPEQVLIVEHITAKTSGISAAEEFARRQIDFLQEYRTRLIADVVTGKLDVREAAASLLEEADERDPLDEGVPLESAEELAMESEVTV